MITQTAHPSQRKPASIATQAKREFRIAYADAVDPDMTSEEWEIAAQKRKLTWQFPHRLPLADAVRIYALVPSYNAFCPEHLRNLQNVFGAKSIQVTLAREYSPAVYLHIPDHDGLRQRVESFVREHFCADEVWWTDAETLRVWWD